MGIVPARIHHKEYGETAALLLQMAAEMNINKWDIKTVPGGFSVPDVISDVLNPTAQMHPDVPDVAAPTGAPPTWWDEPQQTSDVEVDAEGKVYLKETPVEFVEAPVEVIHGTLELSAEFFQPPVHLDTRMTAGPSPVAKDADIRSWAEENGIKVAAKGRLAQSVVDAYNAAQE